MAPKTMVARGSVARAMAENKCKGKGIGMKRPEALKANAKAIAGKSKGNPNPFYIIHEKYQPEKHDVSLSGLEKVLSKRGHNFATFVCIKCDRMIQPVNKTSEGQSMTLRCHDCGWEVNVDVLAGEMLGVNLD